MTVNLEKISNLECKLDISIPQEKIEAEVSKRLHDLAAKIKMDGFRPGKVPFNIVETRYKSGVLAEVLEDLTKSSYKEALEKENLKPAIMPKLEPEQYKPGESFKYSVRLELLPAIKLDDFSKIQVEKLVGEITEQDIDDTIELLRKKNCSWHETTAEAKRGDQVVIEYTDPVSGENIQDKTIELGSVPLLADFEKAIYGAKAGDELNVQINYPDDYSRADLAGKKADYNIKLKKVLEPKLPTLDENFVKSYGVENGDIGTLREQLRDNMKKELDQAFRSRMRREIFKQLAANNEIDLPPTLLKKEIETVRRIKKRERERYDHALPFLSLKANAAFEDSDADVEKEARKNLSIRLLLGEVIDFLGIKLDPERYHNQLAAFALMHGIPPKELSKFYDKYPEQLDHLQFVALEEQAADALEERASKIEKKISYKDAIQSLIDS